MNLNFLPFSMYAEGFVSDVDADKLENYINEDVSKIEYKRIDSDMHNFYTSSPSHDLNNDGIEWNKYKDLLVPYILDFLNKLTDNIKSINLELYLNVCKNNSFIAPHYDGDPLISSFMLLYCPKKYENSNPYTTYLTSEKYHQTFFKYEKLPKTKDNVIKLYHERGKFFIVPTNLLHWVSQVNDDIERITLITGIDPEFK